MVCYCWHLRQWSFRCWSSSSTSCGLPTFFLELVWAAGFLMASVRDKASFLKTSLLETSLWIKRSKVANVVIIYYIFWLHFALPGFVNSPHPLANCGKPNILSDPQRGHGQNQIECTAASPHSACSLHDMDWRFLGRLGCIRTAYVSVDVPGIFYPFC